MSSIQRFLQAVRLLRRIGPQLRASQIDLVLAVAVNPGRSQTELARDCALTPAAVSRQVDVLGVTGRKDDIGGKAGLLCIKRDPLDDRIWRVYLTPEGEQFASLLETILNDSVLAEGPE